MGGDGKLILPYDLPGDLGLLGKQEQEMRDKSVFEINKSTELSDHLELIRESLGIIYFLSRNYRHQTDDELTIQCLGTRIFNSIASSLKMLLSGYYQGSLMFQRDILETSFLLDFFTIERPDGQSEISAWKVCEKRHIEYAPVKIRIALDERDDLTEQKRRERYVELCEYGTHPSYAGFIMLAPDELVKIGPFFNLDFLVRVLYALAVYALTAMLTYQSYFPINKLSTGVVKDTLKQFLKGYLGSWDRLTSWSKKYWEIDPSKYSIDNIRTEIAKLEAEWLTGRI